MAEMATMAKTQSCATMLRIGDRGSSGEFTVILQIVAQQRRNGVRIPQQDRLSKGLNHA
jgi:hypothetical protein